jgi:hypothetical protein
MASELVNVPCVYRKTSSEDLSPTISKLNHLKKHTLTTGNAVEIVGSIPIGYDVV